LLLNILLIEYFMHDVMRATKPCMWYGWNKCKWQNLYS